MTPVARRRGRLVVVVLAVGVIAAGALGIVLVARPAPAEEQTANIRLSAAIKGLQDASSVPIEIELDRGSPTAVLAEVAVGGNDPVEKGLDYLARMRALYGVDRPDVGLVVKRVTDRDDGPDAAIFAQTYRGVPVFGAQVSVISSGDTVLGTIGALRPNIAVETTPLITASDAAAAATSGTAGLRVNGRPALYIFDPSLFGDPFPKAPGANDPRLVWQVATSGPEADTVLVDALTGGVAFRLPRVEHAFVIDLKTFGGTANAGGLDCNEAAATAPGEDREALEALNLFHEAYDWYELRYGIDSWNGGGVTVKVRLDAFITYNGQESPNAYWFQDCQLFGFSDGWVRPDVVAHEYQHAVTGDYVDLHYSAVSSAINESISDTFVMFRTGLTSVTFPERRGGRNFADPHQSSPWQPNRYGELTDGWIEEHIMAGIPTLAAYLLTHGGTHPDTGIAVQALPQNILNGLYFSALAVLPDNPTSFNALRLALLTQAGTMGLDAGQVCAIQNAFAAVQVGPSDVDCDGVVEEIPDEDHDHVPTVDDNCPTKDNPWQEDYDDDGIGNDCDADLDGDGVAQTGGQPTDNCPYISNPDQLDVNQDGKGAACDSAEDGDVDDDSVPDKGDNCVNTFNLRPQPDLDADGEGDACDSDRDGDRIANAVDNCRDVANTNQADGDDDKIGDACDSCPVTADTGITWESTTVISEEGRIQTVIVAVAPDSDGDGISDVCDRQVEGDGATLRIEGAGIRPPGDNVRTDLILDGSAGGEVSIFTVLCAIVCEEAPPPDPCVEARVSGADATTRTSIVSGDGDVVARSSGGDATLRYEPDGNTSYALYFERLSGAAGEDRMVLELGGCGTGGSGATPPPATGPTPVPLPSFGTDSAKVEYTYAGKTISLTGGRCAVAVLDGYAFSVSAGTFGGGDFIAVTAMQVSVPLAGSWAATLTGTAEGTNFATFSGVLTVHADNASGEFSGQTPTGEQIAGAFVC